MKMGPGTLRRFGRAAVMPLPIVGGRLGPAIETRRRLGASRRVLVASGHGTVSAVQTFAPPVKTWYPSLEPTMIRLATQVRWWQLGVDGDNSFVGQPDLAAKIASVKAALDRLGQGVQVGIGWDWREPLPAAAKPPWRFLNLAAQPPLTAKNWPLNSMRSRRSAAWPLGRAPSIAEARPRPAGPRRGPGPPHDGGEDARRRGDLLPRSVRCPSAA